MTTVDFDLDGTPFSHVGALIAFEVLVRCFTLDTIIPDSLGRLIYFLDVGGVPIPEAAGAESIFAGLRKAAMNDDQPLVTVCSLFDGSLRSYEVRFGNHEQNGRSFAE